MKFFVQLFLAPVAVAICFLGSAEAQQAKTQAKHIFDYCNSHKEKGHTPILAWVPGLLYECYVAKDASAASKIKAMRGCEKARRRVTSKVQMSSKCELAYDGTRISSKMRRALTTVPSAPVRVRIFNEDTGKIDQARGRMYGLKYRNWSRNSNASTFAIEIEGVRICTGTLYPYFILKFTYDYTATCFKRSFKGTARPQKSVVNNGLVQIVPNKAVLKSNKSWIEISF